MVVCETNRIKELIDSVDAKPDGAAQGAADGNTGRDKRGRFTTGNPGGPGNPFGRKCALLRAAFVDELTDKDMRAAARKLSELAAAGSIPAARLMLQYAVGKPALSVNPDHVEIDEWNYFKQTSAMSADVDKVVKSMEPEVVLELGRNVRPILSELARAQLVSALQTGDGRVLGCKKKPHRKARPATGSPSPNGGIGELGSLLDGQVGGTRSAPPSPNGELKP